MTGKKGEPPHCGHRDKNKKKTTTDHPPRKIRRILRVVAYNALFTFAGLILIAIAGEVYLQLTRPTLSTSPSHFVPGVGLLLKPNVEVRYTNNIDFFSISHTNSLGFLDREPIGLERASASCHIAMIGDSYVEAREVPIADKFHVRLEELASRHLPHLDITTSAYGQSNTGQINQLPYYDAFARHLSPKLIVLVFVSNDFWNNSPIMSSVVWKILPDRQPYVTAARDENGTLKLRPPPQDWQRSRPYLRWSYFVRKLYDHIYSFCFRLSGQPTSTYESLFDGWQPKTHHDIVSQYHKKTLSPFFEKELAFTAFGLDQFKERAERDGASLVILTSHTIRTRGHPIFDRLNAMAAARGIPIIDSYDYILRQGANPKKDPRWTHDNHWNVQGHQWAAEALLEYIKKNPKVCTRPASQETP